MATENILRTATFSFNDDNSISTVTLNGERRIDDPENVGQKVIKDKSVTIPGAEFISTYLSVTGQAFPTQVGTRLKQVGINIIQTHAENE